MQESNKEKVAFISATLPLADPWKGVVSSIATRLYEEYGRHKTLQSCVRKHKEAGYPSPEDLGALEWLLLHHTPETAEREGRDPLAVLLTTLYLGCCDVEEFVTAVMRCLEGGPVARRRLWEASMRFIPTSMVFGPASYIKSLQVWLHYLYVCTYFYTVIGCVNKAGCVSRLVHSLPLLIVRHLYRKAYK